ncbi:hypothetical protein Tco_0026911 [Tanacetum coccineum]
MRSLRTVGSTIHSMIKFPTNQGNVSTETSREALWECRQLEKGFTAALAVLIIGASISRQHGKSELVGSGSFRLGDVDLLLVTFNSELKIFDSLLNNQASCEHSQCYYEVGNIIAREIYESVLNNNEKHVLDVIDMKT